MRERDVHVFHVCCDDQTAAATSMKEATVLGVIGGAAVLAIVGFTWAGSLTESTRKSAAERADRAFVMPLTPLRVAKFNMSGAVVHLAALKKIS